MHVSDLMNTWHTRLSVPFERSNLFPISSLLLTLTHLRGKTLSWEFNERFSYSEKECGLNIL